MYASQDGEGWPAAVLLGNNNKFLDEERVRTYINAERSSLEMEREEM